ncbi:MAG: peptidyl-prolyl cis-trans isomerase [Alphaproteobacteria bacterium]|nr:peptidyl-prolyl cis-trans isomerase [Alphaproteobacteria bacterium]
MISKFASMRDSWFTKIILTVTALSFMSLFGVSGYISSANRNKTVIKVDDIEISQNEFNYAVQKEISKMRAVGMDLDEDGKVKAQIVNTLAQTMLEDAIVQNTMRKYNVDFTDSLVRNVIFSQPQFLDAQGRFDREAYKWFLSRANQTEQELINEIKLSLARRLLVDSQVSYTNVPEVLSESMQKVLGQRRTFSYMKIAKDDAVINRQPDEDELDTLYDDFAEEFAVPEKRDITVMFLSMDDIEKNIEIAPEEIAAYYKEHIDEYEQPEQRAVLQLVFENEEDATAAAQKLANGTGFMNVAAAAGQTMTDVSLGYVARADLADELAEVVFALNKGQTSEVVEIADSWQILRVTDIKAPQKADKAKAEAEIADSLRQDKLYDASYEQINAIEDKLGAGQSLEDIAQSYGVELIAVKNLAEDGTAELNNAQLAQILQKNKDVADSAFTYNEGEITQAIEDDNGILLVRVDGIIPEHQLPREEATPRLMQLWQDSEKTALTQEKVDNVSQDLEQGDAFSAVAARYGLRVAKSMPISRRETIADIAPSEMLKLFTLPQDEATVIEQGDDYLVITTTNIYDDSKSLTATDKNFLLQSLHQEISQEMADALLKDFASKYKVEVNQHRMGLDSEE